MYIICNNPFTCRYSPDRNLLKLEKIAKENGFGSIWSGIRKDFVLGARQEDNLHSDATLREFRGFDQAAAERTGFPLKFSKPGQIEATRFKPWHERRVKKQLETATRSHFREHQNRISNLPYGFVLDMTSVR